MPGLKLLFPPIAERCCPPGEGRTTGLAALGRSNPNAECNLSGHGLSSKRLTWLSDQEVMGLFYAADVSTVMI